MQCMSKEVGVGDSFRVSSSRGRSVEVGKLETTDVGVRFGRCE